MKKPCSTCGEVKEESEFRKGSNQCKACVKAYNKAYYKAYYATNAEKLKATQKAYREANAEKEKARQKAYREANPEKYRTCARNRRARKRKSQGTHTAQDIRFLLNLQHNSCACCGTRFPDKGKNRFHVDHIVPLAHDSLTPYNSVDNLQLLCPTCNIQKHTQVVDYRSKRDKKKVSEYLQQSLL